MDSAVRFASGDFLLLSSSTMCAVSKSLRYPNAWLSHIENGCADVQIDGRLDALLNLYGLKHRSFNERVRQEQRAPSMSLTHTKNVPARIGECHFVLCSSDISEHRQIQFRVTMMSFRGFAVELTQGLQNVFVRTICRAMQSCAKPSEILLMIAQNKGNKVLTEVLQNSTTITR